MSTTTAVSPTEQDAQPRVASESLVACECGLRVICHRYRPTTKRNDGRCLIRDCPCNEEIAECRT